MTAATATIARRNTRNARPAWLDEPATASQVATLRKHAPRKVLPAGMADALAAKLADGSMTKGDAKLFLDILFDASTPWKPRPVAPAAAAALAIAEKGRVYVTTDGAAVVRVKESKAGRLYGERATFPLSQGIEWTYVPNHALGDALASARIMTLDEAAAASADLVCCVRCSRKLTLETSRARGMGDICASYMG